MCFIFNCATLGQFEFQVGERRRRAQRAKGADHELELHGGFGVVGGIVRGTRMFVGT